MPKLNPGLIGLKYADLFLVDGLKRLDELYLKKLSAIDSKLNSAR